MRPDSLAPEDVEPLLRGRFGRPYVYVESCPSTQRLLEPDAPEGAVAATDEQTAGRGRLGRRWLAPPRSSVLCSIRLLPAVAPERLPELSIVGARACADAIAEITGLQPELKHPNDVLVGGRKVAGVLGEASEGRITLGVGVNVHQRREELAAVTETPPTALDHETETRIDRAALLAALLDHLERRYDEWLLRTRPGTGSRGMSGAG